MKKTRRQFIAPSGYSLIGLMLTPGMVTNFKNQLIMENNKIYDAVIIGGSYAGLSAGMALGRAIRNVLVIDNGQPCNRQTPHSHNFLTQDGKTPAEIASISKAQVLAYSTVAFLNDKVTAAERENKSYVINTLTGKTVRAKKLLFATGIKDLLPNVPGFAACWGISVIHCPYCHGYEFKDKPTGIYVNGEAAFEMGRLIHNWTKRLTIFTNGTSAIPAEHEHKLAQMGIKIDERPLQKINHKKGHIKHLVFADGSIADLDALYARVPFEQHTDLPKQLGCSFTSAGYIQVDEFQKTTVPGVYAAGDNTTMFRSVSVAVAGGSKAGGSINHELIADNQ